MNYLIFLRNIFNLLRAVKSDQQSIYFGKVFTT